MGIALLDRKEFLMDIQTLTALWPIFVAFVLLIVTLAQAHYRIKVLEEKVKVAFELINKINERND
tara:strand:- start:222 stop:416 length:195 start_codon:yes stop_codon:yes gene_type:complete